MNDDKEIQNFKSHTLTLDKNFGQHLHKLYSANTESIVDIFLKDPNSEFIVTSQYNKLETSVTKQFFASASSSFFKVSSLGFAKYSFSARIINSSIWFR